MTDTFQPGDERLDALIDRVEAKGYLPEPTEEWKRALRTVPRHAFVPDQAWVFGGPQPAHAIDRNTRPVEWWNAVYLDAPIIIQTDDGASDHTAGQGSATSHVEEETGPSEGYNF